MVDLSWETRKVESEDGSGRSRKSKVEIIDEVDEGRWGLIVASCWVCLLENGNSFGIYKAE